MNTKRYYKSMPPPLIHYNYKPIEIERVIEMSNYSLKLVLGIVLLLCFSLVGDALAPSLIRPHHQYHGTYSKLTTNLIHSNQFPPPWISCLINKQFSVVICEDEQDSTHHGVSAGSRKTMNNNIKPSGAGWDVKIGRFLGYFNGERRQLASTVGPYRPLDPKSRAPPVRRPCLPYVRRCSPPHG